jgi:hypothetical protein
MARGVLTVQTIPAYGGKISNVAMTAASADHHEFVNDGKTFILALNTNGATRDVTISAVASVRNCNHATSTVATVPITTGVSLLGPFPQEVFNQSDGLVHLDTSAQAGLTLAAFTYLPTPAA